MLQFLPPMPDVATLETMAWWAGGGALFGLGAWAIAWIVNHRTTFGDTGGWELPPVDIPGFEPPGEDERKRTSPGTALRLIAGGAVGGALMGWVFAGPEMFDDKLQLVVELFAVGVAAVVLIRTMQDIPAVGEAPPDDPDEAPSVRVRNAALKLGAAAFMLAMVWLTLD